METNSEMMSELVKRFTYHPPAKGQPAIYQMLRGEAKNLAKTIVRYCPSSRERSLAITKLEEVVMWANASIARRESS